MTRRILILSIAFCAALSAQTTLKDAYKNFFRVGAALNPRTFTEQNAAAAAVVKAQFDQISPENDLKWQLIHPQLDTYNFANADKYVEFGEKNNMFIVGHCLVWHSQVPAWVFRDANNQPLTRDALLQRMKDHITTVVGRYKGRIKGWDVVNEALNEDGTMRPSQWQRIIGDDFIIKAFEYAHAADPQAELYYNDYNLENEAKLKGAVEIVKKLKAAGAHITAVGTQGHDNMTWPTLAQQEILLQTFKALGVKVCVTEMDIDVLPSAQRQQSADISATAAGGANPYVNGLPDDVAKAQTQRFVDLFRLFLKYKDTVTRVTLWGVGDGESWKNNFPVQGRTNYPLLFDRQFKPKPAVDALIQLARQTK